MPAHQFKNVQYYVEGQNEEKLVSVLKTEMQVIPPGAAEVLNPLVKLIAKAKRISYRPKTTVVLIFDTDKADINPDIFQRNLKNLQNIKNVEKILTVTQVKTIEDELIHSTDIRMIEELLPSKNAKAFKNDFNHQYPERIARKLAEHHFRIDLLWSRQPGGLYARIANEGALLKKQ
jgi:hypothetical protein